MSSLTAISNKFTALNEPLYKYFVQHSVREPEVLSRLREETSRLEMSVMQISPEQGQFLSLLIKLLNVQRAIEVGVFTGYSSLAVAMSLPEDGLLVACDINKEWTDMARRFWKEADVEKKIQLKLGPAVTSLQALVDSGEQNQFDYAFIDADKTNYRNYYELCLTLVKPGGIILIDNVLWGGAVIDDSDQSEDTIAIRELNEFILNDTRIDLSMLPLADGLTLIRPR